MRLDKPNARVWYQVRYQVLGRVWDQVWDQVLGRVWDQVWDRVWGQLARRIKLHAESGANLET
jgi:hypothetical protein